VKTIEILFPGLREQLAEVLIAELSLLGYESFWESDEGLRAYVPADLFDERALLPLSQQYGVAFQKQAASVGEWSPAEEDQHPPIWLAEGKVYIRNQQQPPEPTAPISLVIESKLSFGSGHHPSTALCVDWIMQQAWSDQTVLDVGTGSGILALLADRHTQGTVEGFDNNPWAIEVALLNSKLNLPNGVHFFVADPTEVERSYDVVLANLNAQAIGASFAELKRYLRTNGRLLLSGYRVEDAEPLHKLGQELRLKRVRTIEKEGWLATEWQ